MALEKLYEEGVEDPTLTRIFGTSKVFRGLDQPKVSVKGLLLPNKVKEHFQHGQDAIAKGEWEKAVIAFSKSINLNPHLVESYVFRAEAFLQLCDFASAAQNLRKATLLAPHQQEFMDRLCFVLYLQGQCLFEHHSYMKALDLFTQASELQPHNSSYRFRSIACLLAMKQHQECLQMITKELKQNPNPDAFIFRARLYNYFLKPNQCYQDLHRALSMQPEHPEANTLLEKLLVQARKIQEEAMIAALKGNLEDSLIRINYAIENNPMDPAYYLFRGTLFRRLKDFDAAIEDFVKALELSPESDEDTEVARQAQRQLLLTYNDFAVFCYTKCAYEEGVLLLNKALQGEKKEKGIYINRGDCFFKLGELTFAEADYLEALALCPGDQGARYRMGMVQEKLGLRKQQLRQYDKAEKHFTSAIEYNPERANLYLFRARSRLMLQDIFGARQDVLTMLLLNPKHPQLVPMMANLFPGQSTESVLNSKTMVMAKTVLERAMQNQFQRAQDVLGLLTKSPSKEDATGPCPNTEKAELQEDVSRTSIAKTQDENLMEDSRKQAVGQQVSQVSQEVRQEVSQEVRQEGNQEVRQEVRQEGSQEVSQEVRQEGSQEVSQEVHQEGSQEMRQEGSQEVRQEGSQEVRQEGSQEVRQEGSQEVSQEVRQEGSQEVNQKVSQEVSQKVSQEVSQEEKSGSSPMDQASLGQTSSLEAKIDDPDQSESKTTVDFS